MHRKVVPHCPMDYGSVDVYYSCAFRPTYGHSICDAIQQGFAGATQTNDNPIIDSMAPFEVEYN
jgi:hypothetical protein